MGFLDIAVPNWLLRWYVDHFVQLDPHQKCPACGHKNGSIRWAPEYRPPSVQHNCNVCHAAWPEAPIRKATGTNSWWIEFKPADESEDPTAHWLDERSKRFKELGQRAEMKANG